MSPQKVWCRLSSVGLFLLAAVRPPIAEAWLLPPSLGAAARSESIVDLRWDDPNSSETGYAIERSFSSSTGFAPIALARKNATSYQDSGISPGTTCYYRVQ